MVFQIERVACQAIGAVPRGESIFDVVGGGVDEDFVFGPGATLHSDVLMDVTQAL